MASGMTTQERRQAPRVAERVALAMTEANVLLQAETKNLSASGAYCTVDRFIAPMTKLELQFELPIGARRATIRCSGVVVRVDPVVANAQRAHYNMAIFFTGLSDRERSVIEQFVRRRLSAAPSTD